MTTRYGFKPGAALLFFGITLGLLLIGSRPIPPVTAGEPTQAAQNRLADGLPQTGLPELDMRIAHKRYRLEVAATPSQSEKGLMYRTELPRDHGMLFRFEPAQPVNFWMKNTRIPLDMVFLREGRVRHVVHGAVPCTTDPCTLYPSQVPVDTTVELPAGTAKRDGIGIGDPVVFENPVPPKAAPQGK